jgi:hypothetical protein
MEHIAVTGYGWKRLGDPPISPSIQQGIVVVFASLVESAVVPRTAYAHGSPGGGDCSASWECSDVVVTARMSYRWSAAGRGISVGKGAEPGYEPIGAYFRIRKEALPQASGQAVSPMSVDKGRSERVTHLLSKRT